MTVLVLIFLAAYLAFFMTLAQLDTYTAAGLPDPWLLIIAFGMSFGVMCVSFIAGIAKLL